MKNPRARRWVRLWALACLAVSLIPLIVLVWALNEETLMETAEEGLEVFRAAFTSEGSGNVESSN